MQNAPEPAGSAANPNRPLRLIDLEQRVLDVAAEQLGLCRQKISPRDRILEDLGCDSLDLVEFIMAVEETFGVTLPDDAPNPVYKAVFTRQPFCLSDVAELVYLQHGTGTPNRRAWRGPKEKPLTPATLPFSQLDGRWHRELNGKLLEPLTSQGSHRQFRRRSDGMRCVLIPSAAVEIGCDVPGAGLDEQPKHIVELDSFVIDAEPVSTTAYCRFLNSLGDINRDVLADWFVLDPQDDRNQHMLIAFTAGVWQAVPGTERWPMILVSWYGANAYSLWANGKDWKSYRSENDTWEESFLPSEAQWEYAARGNRCQPYPWGNGTPSQELMRYGQHRRLATYRADAMPMADVNEMIGMSPFGLHHMAGNVWQWCRDWYDDSFYSRLEATNANAVNRIPSGVRSERGGSWVGPAELCRSSFRRGRPPAVRGRCLGFRCISKL
jgi:formylglycine-generating enzyme